MAAAKGKSGGRKAAPKGAGKTQKISAPGKKPITFQKGGLHQALGVPQGQKIPASKMAAAAAGNYGPKAKAQANFAQNVLKTGQQTAAKNRSRKSSTSKKGK